MLKELITGVEVPDTSIETTKIGYSHHMPITLHVTIFFFFLSKNGRSSNKQIIELQ